MIRTVKSLLCRGTTAPNFHVGVECEKGDAQQSISSTLTTEMGRHATAAEGTIMRRVGGLSSGVQVKYCTAHGFVGTWNHIVLCFLVCSYFHIFLFF